MLWIAVHLPQLALEAFSAGISTPEAWAVADGQQLVACDRKARARGVHPGMTLSTAHALAPKLNVRPRDPALETEALLALAAWAGRFTSSVALEFPQALVLETEGSLRLFGGIEPLLAEIRRGIAEMGYSAYVAAAPTAQGARWLARAGVETHVMTAAALADRIAALPARVLGCDEGTLEGLAAIGVRSIGEITRLPRDGFARRFGQRILDDIDRGLGRLPDPRTFFVPPATFRAGIELPAEVTQADALLFASRRLILQLEGFLAGRSGGIQRFTLRLAHREARATELAIGLVAPSRDAAHFVHLLRERLSALALREPVRAIAIAAEDIVPLAGETLPLFGDGVAAALDWARLVERLRARLGSRAVHGIELAADHRPERAWRSRDPAAKCTPRHAAPPPPSSHAARLEVGRRPFWLIAEPKPLAEVGTVPHHDGPLTLLAGPERIESGWWDGIDVARDYFIARTADRSLVWIYRERREPGGWFLHGLFS